MRTEELAVPVALATREARGREDSRRSIESITTRRSCTVSPGALWQALLFYEEIEKRPPLRLRLLLPVPVRTVGPRNAVGDESLCVYEGGFLRKRLTHVDPLRRQAFEVTHQDLPLRGIRLLEGCYRMRPLPGGRTEIALETRYASPRRPRWLWRPVERLVCHAFHHHILRAILGKAFPEHPGERGEHP